LFSRASLLKKFLLDFTSFKKEYSTSSIISFHNYPSRTSQQFIFFVKFSCSILEYSKLYYKLDILEYSLKFSKTKNQKYHQSLFDWPETLKRKKRKRKNLKFLDFLAGQIVSLPRFRSLKPGFEIRIKIIRNILTLVYPLF